MQHLPCGVGVNAVDGEEGLGSRIVVARGRPTQLRGEDAKKGAPDDGQQQEEAQDLLLLEFLQQGMAAHGHKHVNEREHVHDEAQLLVREERVAQHKHKHYQ